MHNSLVLMDRLKVQKVKKRLFQARGPKEDSSGQWHLGAAGGEAATQLTLELA